MKKYKVCFNKKYLKDLQKIPKIVRENIIESITELETNPRPDGCKKLLRTGASSLYRIRCGDYRIVYTIQDDVLLILIVEAGHRREIYH